MSGCDEFGQLGEAFDAMAALLQRHHGELREEVARSYVLQKRQTMMLHESNHRVHNTLNTVQPDTQHSTWFDQQIAVVFTYMEHEIVYRLIGKTQSSLLPVNEFYSRLTYLRTA